MYMSLCKHTFLFLLSKNLGMEVFGFRVGGCLIVKETSRPFSKEFCPETVYEH